MTLRKKQLGVRGEEMAVSYLKGLGYRILARNFRTRLGEIDIIAEHEKDLVFIEVKTRSDSLYGSPLESVTGAKQRQLSKVALEYMGKYACHDQPARFDVVGIRVSPKDGLLRAEGIELVRNAFDLCYGNESA